jgi:hypothetical protein
MDLADGAMGSDEDRIMFVQQRKESQVLVGRWKKTMLLLESSEAEVVHLRDTLSYALPLLSSTETNVNGI